MKILKKELIIILLFIAILIPINCSAVYIEIKPNTTAARQLTISEVYDLCKDLKNADTTLGNNNLDPHLTLNRDWGALAYLGMSVYGGITDVYSSSSTGNNTGVMKLSDYGSFTASILDGVTSNSDIARLIEDQDTKYVEKLPSEYTAENTRGQALYELVGKWGLNLAIVNSTYPTVLRSSFWSSTRVQGCYSTKTTSSVKKETLYTIYSTTGGSFAFRPVIWNKVNK